MGLYFFFMASISAISSASAGAADVRCAGPEISYEKNNCGYYLSVTSLDGSNGYMNQCSPDPSEIVRLIREKCAVLAARVNVPSSQSCNGAIQIVTLGGGYQITVASTSGKSFAIQEIVQNGDPRIQAIREECVRYYRKEPPIDAARISSSLEKKEAAPNLKMAPPPRRQMETTPSN